MRFRLPIIAAVLSVTVFLSACDNAKERAEKHFQAGMDYIQTGDVDRALVEFRNVFQLDGTHHGARLAYAEAERKRGNLREAYSQYLRLVEQYPDDMVGLRALSDMAAANGEWEDAHRFIATALGLAPTDTNLQALKIFSDYGAAIEGNNPAAIASSVKAAQALRQTAPKELLLRKVIIDDLVRSQSFDQALKELDAAIEIAPEERILYAQRLSVYAALSDNASIETGLLEMVKKFPDAPEMSNALLRWYVARNELDKAEALLRSKIDPSSDDPAPVIELVGFLSDYRGPDAAVAELDKVIASGKSVAVFRSARAGFKFDQGDHAGAIAEMDHILETAQPGDETRKIKIGLARMKLVAGDAVAARALVEDVLSEDSGQIEAIKLKSTWLILDDQVGDAISLLREAIVQNPNDPAILTLLAQAYERNGEKDLMRETLSRAVEASGRAPAESLRYAQLLSSEGKFVLAEGVLIDALRIAPGDVTLLVPLGQIYVQIKDWSRAAAVADDIESLHDENVKADLVNMRSAILVGQQKTAEAASYLAQMASGKDGQIDAKIALLRNQLNDGHSQEALTYAAQMLSEDPANLDLQFVHASVLSWTGDNAGAETAFRSILANDAKRPVVWLALYRVVSADKARKAEATTLLDDALAAVPDSGELRWAKAGLLEASGDIEGSVAIYESLYKENSANPIVANNLASLLSNYYKDKDSLARAEVIARRLKGSGLPPYQDTFGWIAYLNNNFTSAVPELEGAAAGLPDDPTVQYHLGMVYLALERNEDAAKQLQKVLGMIPADDSRDFAVSTRSELEKLKAAGFVK